MKCDFANTPNPPFDKLRANGVFPDHNEKYRSC